MALFFGLGAFVKLFYVIVLLLNAVSVLSEDRFLARSVSRMSFHPRTILTHFSKVGWGRTQADAGFGGRDDSGTKARTVDLIASVRTVMRSTAHEYEGLKRQTLLTQVERSTINSDKYDHHFIRTRSGLREDRNWHYACFTAWERIEKCSIMLRRTSQIPEVLVTVSPILYMEQVLQTVLSTRKSCGGLKSTSRCHAFRSTKPFCRFFVIQKVILGSVTSLSDALAMESTSKTRWQLH
ncbi:hypothetical protein GJ744_009920 [Endocarpon pusillum]|uniref:Uncharacterized protein n=1 Tax=Endocarpon pusillum TaxID=364733 RepID=A0A8H7AF95_9EURO|nr:hypothetical protein GJ744_009920 [Endocarpon pusillum]